MHTEGHGSSDLRDAMCPILIYLVALLPISALMRYRERVIRFPDRSARSADPHRRVALSRVIRPGSADAFLIIWSGSSDSFLVLHDADETFEIPTRHRMPASMNPSISPSSTALVLPVSYSVRRSLTIW
jgi:hypothetical protein